MDPSDPNILYAGTAQRLRYRWNDPIESIESGLYKTTDGGKTWTPLTAGLPDFSKGECERFGISVGKANPNVVYVVINQQPKDAAKQGAYLYRSDDKGGSFRLVEGNEKIRSTFAYGWVFGQVRVDPANPDVVYVMGLNYFRSKDAGATWESLRGNHVDYHGMWINPTDSNHILVVNDGGIAISHDGLATFTHPVNLPIGHLFSIAVSQTKGTFWASSNIQDTGGWRGQIDMTAGRDQVTWKEWESAPGDESGRHAVHPTDPDVVYFVTRYGGGPSMVDFKKVAEAQAQSASAPPAQGQAAGARRGGRAVRRPSRRTSAPRRSAPSGCRRFIISPHDPNRLLYGAQFVFLTDDQGKTWKKISPDLTNFDPARQGNITVFHGLVNLGIAGEEGPDLRRNRRWQHPRDEERGGDWEKITKGLPAELFIASIEASRFDEGTVYVVVNGKRHNDFNTYLFKSTDYRKTWANIATAVPGGIANVVKEDPTNKNILYLGTDLAVYMTIDGGKTWNVLGSISRRRTCSIWRSRRGKISR